MIFEVNGKIDIKSRTSKLVHPCTLTETINYEVTKVCILSILNHHQNKVVHNVLKLKFVDGSMVNLMV